MPLHVLKPSYDQIEARLLTHFDCYLRARERAKTTHRNYLVTHIASRSLPDSVRPRKLM
jgi:hypothetical protein